MKKLKYWLLIVLLSIKWMFKVCLGDKIVYQGKEYEVINGVVQNSWKLSGLDNGHDGWVQRKECKKVKALSNVIGSFKSGYNFYMSAWYSLWVKVGIKQWMKNCPIWGK